MTSSSDSGWAVARPAAESIQVPEWALSRRILVVEDSPSARKLLQALLLRLGVTLPNLRLAADTGEALRVLTAWQPEIAFVDLQLRGPAGGDAAVTGSGIAAAMKNGEDLAVEMLKRNPAMKVIICSASEPDSAVLVPLLKSGRVRSMVKPILAAKVAETLAAVSDSPRPPSRSR